MAGTLAIETGCGERMKSGGFGRRADWRLKRLNALILRDVKVPKRSGDRRGNQTYRTKALQRDEAVKLPPPAQTVDGVESKSERAA